MKASLKIGALGRLSTEVGLGQTIRLGGHATVFSTPSMINLMEHAARDALSEHLEEGEESVGVDVQINHSSATPPKAEVIAEATVTKVDKNVVSFDVVARDPWGEIGHGTHRRAIIKTAKFAEKLAEQKPSPMAPQTREPNINPSTDAETTSLPEFSTLNCTCNGSVLRIKLARPEKRNAINQAMTVELEMLARWLSKQSVNIRVVIFAGAGGDFSAGDDVADLPVDRESARQLSIRRGKLYQQMTALPQLLVAVIDGLALGGGLVFASACDIRVATHRAKLGLPEVSLGWPPNYGMGIVQSLIGRGRALELALTGKPIDARRAQSMGLVSHVTSPAQLESTLSDIAANSSAIPAQALAATKRLLQPDQSWCDERASNEFVECLATDAARQSIAKFRR